MSAPIGPATTATYSAAIKASGAIVEVEPNKFTAIVGRHTRTEGFVCVYAACCGGLLIAEADFQSFRSV